MAKLTPKRRAILNDVKRQIRASIKRNLNNKDGYAFDMSNWITINKRSDIKTTQNGVKPLAHGFCGTAGCIAGTIAVHQGYKPKFIASDYWEDEQSQASYGNIWRKPHSAKTYDIKGAAARELGLDDDEASMLFLPMDYPTSNVWFGLNSTKPEDAIEAINRFIKAGGKIYDVDEYCADIDI